MRSMDRPSASIASSTLITGKNPSVMSNCVIEGDIPPGAELTIYGNAIIYGDIGKDAKIEVYGTLECKDIGKHAHVTAYSVDAHDIGERAHVTATRYSL